MSRKFFLALFATVSATALCWCHRMSGGEWVTAQSIILGLYKASNLVDKKFGDANAGPA